MRTLLHVADYTAAITALLVEVHDALFLISDGRVVHSQLAALIFAAALGWTAIRLLLRNT